MQARVLKGCPHHLEQVNTTGKKGRYDTPLLTINLGSVFISLSFESTSVTRKRGLVYQSIQDII